MRISIVVALVLALANPARADGFYLTEQWGGSDVHDELGAYYGSALSLRIAIGMRHERWALEAFVAAHIDNGSGTPTREETYVDDYQSLTTYGVDVKYLQPLSRHLEGYVRGRISRGIGEGTRLEGFEGRGLGFGAGVQLEGRVRALGFLAWPLFFVKWGPKVNAALFLDAGHDFYRLHPGGQLHVTPAIDAKLTTITIGFAVGSDF